jgi:hypothetical protein
VVVAALTLITGCAGDASLPEPTTSATASKSVYVDVDPSPDVWPSAGDVLRGLAAKGVPLTAITTYTASDDPDGQVGSITSLVSKASVADSRVAAEPGGPARSPYDAGVVVEVFESASAAKVHSGTFFQSFKTEPVPLLFTYGPVVVFVSGELTNVEQTDYTTGLADYVESIS